ncbi:ABC transporter substrate-binding protein [Gordonia sp. zg691]|uniref:ABC transporter substrate-binding protein n=1 Tax=Gordonia jinghuaiqii TaxID=2758710 RepID=A0A7D7QYG6_9ACTN|nr:ABC transporter substrate-binding protein [Gordonia jinghuaiqii]MBD0861767.1 ABC transporter substrate-binding protein [Gordonia jinghuaiqii]MCR5977660.1 ABC transporter substrate-binding protein [Gordonia jinghuaiqii]QMT02329.1 ABC transporter substrate-binding protein [Gordonia jinghuaiqii]
MKLGGQTRHRRAIAGLSALALVSMAGLTACGSDESSSNDASAAPTTSLPADPADGAPVKVGFISPEGGAAVSIPEYRQGAEAAVKYVNDNAGGLAGRPVELVVCKQQEEPTSATKCANELVEQGVAAVLTPGTSMGQVIVPIISGAKIPYVTLNAVSAAELSSPGVSALSSGLPGSLTTTATAAKDAGLKKVTIFASDGGGIGTVISQMGGPIFQGMGVDLKVVPIPLGVPDPTPMVTAGLSEKPDGISVVADAGTCASVLKAVQTQDPNVKKLLIPTCLDPNVTKVVGMDAIKGNIGITATDYLSDQPDTVLYRSVMGQYAPDLSITGAGSSGYQVVLGLVRASKDVQGEVNAASIAQALKSAKDVEMPAGGGITFTCDGTAFPQMPTLCSTQMLYGPLNDDGVPVDLKLAGQKPSA